MAKKNLIEAKLKEVNVSREELAKSLGISYSTLDNKINGRTEFTVREAEILHKMLSLTSDDIMNIFFSC